MNRLTRPTRVIPRVRKSIFAALLLFILLVLFSVIAILIGPLDIAPSDVFYETLSLTGLAKVSDNPLERAVIQSVRIPRIVLALMVGAALGVSGALMQGFFRNPMADPGVIGVSAGASLGAVSAITLGLAAVALPLLPAMAFAGALIAVLIIHGLARIGGQFSLGGLLLAGIAVSSFLSAGVSALILFTRDITAQREIIFWLAGGLDSARWRDVQLSGLPIVLGIGMALLFARELNLLLLGDDEARALGVRVTMIRNILIVASALTAGAAVAVSGTIAFIGLIAPHSLRLFVGPDNRVLIPLSAMAGAMILLAADTLSRIVLAPAELPVGIISAILGAPFFLTLLVKYKSRISAV